MEIMVAIGILVLVVLGVMQAFPFGAAIIRASENQTKASYIAQSKIEELISQGYNDIGTGNIEPRQKVGSSSSYLYNFERETFAYFIDPSMTSTSTNPIDNVGIKTISIIVYFNSALSKNTNYYKLNYIITER